MMFITCAVHTLINEDFIHQTVIFTTVPVMGTFPPEVGPTSTSGKVDEHHQWHNLPDISQDDSEGNQVNPSISVRGPSEGEGEEVDVDSQEGEC